jgi:hypothetical protein
MPIKYIMEKILGFVHLIYTLYIIIHPLLSYYLYPLYNLKFLDLSYIIILHIVFISYLLLNGECLISVLCKLYNDPNYKLGSSVIDYNDLVSLFGLQNHSLIKLLNDFLTTLLILVICYCIYLLKYRYFLLNNFQIFAFVISYIIVVLFSRKFFNEKFFKKYNLNKYYYVFGIVLIPALLYNIYTIIKYK